jgi:hypothetical protein
MFRDLGVPILTQWTIEIDAVKYGEIRDGFRIARISCSHTCNGNFRAVSISH